MAYVLKENNFLILKSQFFSILKMKKEDLLTTVVRCTDSCPLNTGKPINICK